MWQTSFTILIDAQRRSIWWTPVWSARNSFAPPKSMQHFGMFQTYRDICRAPPRHCDPGSRNRYRTQSVWEYNRRSDIGTASPGSWRWGPELFGARERTDKDGKQMIKANYVPTASCLKLLLKVFSLKKRRKWKGNRAEKTLADNVPFGGGTKAQID